MKTKFKGILTLFLALLVQVTIAQTVTGKVSDADGGLFGASVQVKGTSNATTTDFDGNYSISASATDVLVFNYTGYAPQEIPVGDQTVVNVLMKESLDVIVVTGYRNTTKRKSNISSFTVSSETVEDRPNTSVIQTLQGQVPGLNIGTTSGQPGANSLIQLRGPSSINGNTEPLVIIDGLPVSEDNFRTFNQADAESITVLKDAAATAIYGNRGANGVIVIKTKSGRFETPLKISYQAISGFTSIQDNKYNFYDARGYLSLENRTGRGVGATLTQEEISNYAVNTDWLDVFFRTGTSQSHTLSLNSGSKNLASYTSFNYVDQEGILVDSKLQRFIVRNNLNGKSDNGKFRYNTNVQLGYSKNDEPGSIGSGAIYFNYAFMGQNSLPYLDPNRYERGSTEWFNDTRDFSYVGIDNLNYSGRQEDEIRIIASGGAEYDITSNLTARYSLGADYTSENRLDWEDPNSSLSLIRALSNGSENDGREIQAWNRDFRFNSNASLTYSKSFGTPISSEEDGINNNPHTITSSLYVEYSKSYFNGFGFDKTGLNDRTYEPGSGASFVPDASDDDFYVPTVSAFDSSLGYFSYFGDIDYDYNERFGARAVLRRDASSRFSETNRWGTFYAISGRWNVDKESFMKDSDINFLKLRVSYGSTGNDRLLDTYYGGLNLSRELFGTGNGYSDNQTFVLSQLGNPDLTWETKKSFNIGVDFGVWENRLRGSLELYNEKTEDLFQSIPISLITGASAINANSGSLVNRGIDLSFNYNLLESNGDSNKVNLRLNFVGNYNQNEILEVPTEDGTRDGGNTIVAEGRVLNEFYLVNYVGVNPGNGNLLFTDINGNLTETPSDDDRIYTGRDQVPDFQGSFGFDLDYKNFFLTTQFNYVTGVSRFDYDYSGYLDPNSIGNYQLSADLDRAWTQPGDITDIPSLSASNLTIPEASSNSNRFLSDADFLRLRFVSLGYNFPKKALDNIFLNSARIFVNAENLATFSKWRGFDPEIPSGSSQFEYPTPRIVSFGVELEF